MGRVNKGNISFDVDGVLANFTRGFTRIGNQLYGTPVATHGIQKTWNFEDFAPLKLDKEKCKGIWDVLLKDVGFWADLDPLNPSVMPTIGSIANRVFISNRAGVDPQTQTEAFLERWGIWAPKVFIAADKVPIAITQNVVAHLDDYYPNCVAIKTAIPSAYVALLWTPYNEMHHAEWGQQDDVLLSVEQFIHNCEARGLVESQI
jgi:5' nucleotidase, deoxy (Pyrimidine), cytosolic type C protein (NT5C)